MSENRTIDLSSAADFGRVFTQFCRPFAEKSAVFIERVNIHVGYPHADVTDAAQKLITFAPYAGQDTMFAYTGIPTHPKGWNHLREERIGLTFENKLAMVTYLRDDMHADEKKLSVFSRVKVSQLKEMIDSSSEDAEERTHRATIDKNEKFTIPCSFGDIREVLVTVKKENNCLKYLLSADFSAPWAIVNNSIAAVLKNELASVPQYSVL